jgi:hypothetical protein
MERSETPEQPQPKPKRRFWQLHLSTACVLMILAGGALYLNMLPRFKEVPPNVNICYPSRFFGWPLQMAHQSQEIYVPPDDWNGVAALPERWDPELNLEFVPCAINVVVILGAILSLGLTCEFLIRCRSKT